MHIQKLIVIAILGLFGTVARAETTALSAAEQKQLAVETQNFTNRARVLSLMRGGDPDVMQFLIDKGVDVNYQDDTHTTALRNAVEGLNPEAVKLLLSRGALTNLKDLNDGLDAFGFAREIERVFLLQQKMDPKNFHDASSLVTIRQIITLIKESDAKLSLGKSYIENKAERLQAAKAYELKNAAPYWGQFGPLEHRDFGADTTHRLLQMSIERE